MKRFLSFASKTHSLTRIEVVRDLAEVGIRACISQLLLARWGIEAALSANLSAIHGASLRVSIKEYISIIKN